MQRDLTSLKHPTSFLYDAHNIRLTARGEDTLLTLTNEKGPLYAGITIPGTYLGHCLLGTYLVIFSTVVASSVATRKVNNGSEYAKFLSYTFEEEDAENQVIQPTTELPWGPLQATINPNLPLLPDEEEPDNGSTTERIIKDYITRIDLSTGDTALLYNGDLGFSSQHPIEAIASYENNNIQKVYWTDGLNSPRVINVVGAILEGVDSQFDFVRELALNEKVSIQKQLGAAGSFAPGVIQYALTYYSKYGQESNIFYVSPLLYISYKDRGGSPEDKVENAFKITVTNLDHNFDYLRIYSIQRTSINGTPIVKRVQDIKIDNLAVDVTDKDYDNSPYIKPMVLNGEALDIVNPSFIAIKSLLGSSDTMKWEGFLKSEYPDIVIRTRYGYVTWGKNSTNNSVLWISRAQFSTTEVEYGYQVCETPTESDSTIEPISYSTRNILKGVSFTDTGMVGDAIDPTELLFKGGESVVAETIEQKDNTLFLGNLRLSRPVLNNVIKNSITEGVTIEQDTRTFYPTQVSTLKYAYSNQLTSFSDINKTVSVPCGGFKRGDYYRCGVQFQYKDGKWGDPIWIKDVMIENAPSTIEGTSVTVPTLRGVINQEVSTAVYNLGYRKARAVVVFPEIQDRVTICQGVACPTMYTQTHRNDEDLYAQSSWFFRPSYGGSVTEINPDGSVAPTSKGYLPYTSRSMTDLNIPNWNPSKLRQVEIQGHFDTDDKFLIDNLFSTVHSPDIEFDDHFQVLDFVDTYHRYAGHVTFSVTLSDIDIQTETPTISNSGGGFQHKSFVKYGPHGIISGLFYDDYVVDDRGGTGKYSAYDKEKSSYKWFVYAWNRTGSLNNDINRPADAGARTAVLKKKVISNLRYTITTLEDLGATLQSYVTPQVFSSDQLNIIKVGDHIYQGNVDTLLSPSETDGMYFAFNNADFDALDVVTNFSSSSWWKTFNRNDESADGQGLWRWNTSIWERDTGDIGDKNPPLAISKEFVRMKYKSSPHIVFPMYSDAFPDPKEGESTLPIIELVRNGEGEVGNPYYRSTMFGGSSEDALQANNWVPCGEPVTLSTTASTKIKYSYGDTYFQRWDCLKTYPFTKEDTNQIVEIGSFMLETRINIDGRYDRNRGQVNNLNMTPENFNLINPVYTQLNNYFTYKILKEDYYNINTFENQITWTKEKQAGADVDLWTNITLASTYDMDGAKGAVTSLNIWKDQILCFQEKGVSTILFNSRVQVPTSDGVPIELRNSYKVDGYRYVSEGIGCSNKWTISLTPSGVYFMDSISRHLYHIGEGIRDITVTHNMTSWFTKESNKIVSTLYDDINHDLYLIVPEFINNEGEIIPGKALCYSEILGHFISFMDYDQIVLLESCDNYVYTMRDSKLYFMFKGAYNNFFGIQKEWNFSFISNGVDNHTMDFDKIFSNIDYRMDMFEDSTYKPDNTLDYIQVINEYQDTGEKTLSRLKVIDNPKSYHHKGTDLQKKFRTWRIQIPRNKNSLDRIRNPWCKITLGNRGENNYKAVLHDLNVQYYI